MIALREKKGTEKQIISDIICSFQEDNIFDFAVYPRIGEQLFTGNINMLESGPTESD